MKFTVGQEVHYEVFGGDSIGVVTHVYPSGQAKVKLDDGAEFTVMPSGKVEGDYGSVGPLYAYAKADYLRRRLLQKARQIRFERLTDEQLQKIIDIAQ